MGYPAQDYVPSFSNASAIYKAKTATFFTYTPYDSNECQSISACATYGESSWLLRQYIVTPFISTGTTSSAASTSVNGTSTINVARYAVASASTVSAGQPASAAIDGVLGGYLPGVGSNPAVEWSSNGQGAGATLMLTWSTPVTVSQVVLFDRPNLDDQVSDSTLTFSDGSIVESLYLNNDGSGTVIDIASRQTTSLLFTVRTVSPSTQNIGLSEIQVYGPAG